MLQFEVDQEYPRPQFYRQPWINLNGEWGFRFDDALKGRKHSGIRMCRQTGQSSSLLHMRRRRAELAKSSSILRVWYEREVAIPADWGDKLVKLHFQASDYLTKLWVNGNFVGQHEGGYAAFAFDITDHLSGTGTDKLVVRVEDGNSCTGAARQAALR